MTSPEGTVPAGQRHRMLFVQNGDFLQALRNFDAGGEETYLDQRKSVAFVCDMTATADIVVAAVADEPYDECPRPGLRTIGIRRRDMYGADLPLRLLPQVRPSLCVPRFPHVPLLRALGQAGIPSFPCLADIFTGTRPRDLLTLRGWRRARYCRALQAALSAPSVTAVGNHSLSASVSLHEAVGLAAERIVPWEWTRLPAPPPAGAEGTDPGGPDGLRLVYAGAVSEQKGVGDLIAALGHLAARPVRVHLTIFGSGAEVAQLRRRAGALPESITVEFRGSRPNSEVRACMQRADAVVVPSRHSYAEGLPNVIFEALAAGTVAVVSDHPAFRRRLRDGAQAIVVRAADPPALAAGLARLAEEPGLRQRLRQAAAATLDSLYVGTSWYDLMQKFLDDPEDRTAWVRAHSLASLRDADSAVPARPEPLRA